MSGLPSGKGNGNFPHSTTPSILIISFQCIVKTFQSIAIAEGVQSDDWITEVCWVKMTTIY